MAEEGLKIVIGADVVQVTKSLNQLEKEFQDLGKALKSAIPGTAEFTRLSQEFNKQSVIINRVNQASQAAGTGLGKNLKAGAQEATFALTNFGRVAQDAPFGLIGIANNIDPLVQSFISLRASTGSASAAFSALGASLLGPGGIIFAVSAVTSALSFYALSQRGANKEVKDAKNDTDAYVNNLSKQKEEFLALFNIARDYTQSEERRTAALNELNRIIPDTIGVLNKKNVVEKQGVEIVNAVIAALEARATAELLVGRIAANNVEIFNINNQRQQESIDFQTKLNELLARQQRFEKAGNLEVAAEIQLKINNLLKERTAREKELRGNAAALVNSNIQIRSEYQKQLAIANQLKDGLDDPRKQSNKEVSDGYLFQRGIIAGLSDTINDINKREQERVQIQKELNDLLLKSNQIRKDGQGFNVVSRPDDKANPEKSPIQQLELLAGEFTKLDEQAKLVSDTINNGINQGIDTFFNALANNQDPFKALIQSVQRLVVELGAAVVKSLILKTIANSIAPGSGLAISGLQSAGSNILRSDLLRLAITR